MKTLRIASIFGLGLALSASCSPAAPARSSVPKVDASAESPAPDASDIATAESISPTPGADPQFAAFSARFIRGYLERAPVTATTAGLHDFDGTWPDESAAGDLALLAFIAATRKELTAIPRAALGLQNAIDASTLDTQLDYLEFQITQSRGAERDPLHYTSLIGDGIDLLVTREFAPHDVRMRALRARLEGVPAVVLVAKSRLAHAPRVFTETAIEQNKGLVAMCEAGLAADFAKEPAQKADLEAAAKIAAASLREFQVFLEKDLLPRSDGDFRVGRAKLERILHFELDDDVSIDDLARGARDLLARTQEEMVDTALELLPTLGMKTVPRPTSIEAKKKLVRAVLDALSKDRPTDATILPDAKKLLADATAFVRDHDLVRLPEEPCDVIEMPEYRRGVTVAYCDSSGPLEQKPWALYAISPTPHDWPKARALSFYREYNHSMLADLTVHEAMPGHYLQISHSNQSTSKLRALFASGPFVEGWAVYSEWLMAKYGFGGARVRIERQKMTLRLAANAILDHDIHAGTMTEREALALMTNEAFQEDGEAVGKWKRARLTSGQLTTYYYGFTELMKLRATLEKTPGFTERGYHDKLLAHGSPSIRHIRAIMTPQTN